VGGEDLRYAIVHICLSANDPLKITENRLKQEIDLLKSQNEWFSSEVDKRANELASLRQEKVRGLIATSNKNIFHNGLFRLR